MLRRTRKIAVASIHTKKPSNGQEQQECVLLFGKGKNGAFTSTTKRWTNWIWLNGFQSPKENKQQNEQYFLSAHSLFSYCTPVFLRCLFLLLLLFGIFVWCQYRSFNRKHWHCIYKLSINRLQFFQFFVVVVLLHTFVVFDEFFPRFFFISIRWLHFIDSQQCLIFDVTHIRRCGISTDLIENEPFFSMLH